MRSWEQKQFNTRIATIVTGGHVPTGGITSSWNLFTQYSSAGGIGNSYLCLTEVIEQYLNTQALSIRSLLTEITYSVLPEKSCCSKNGSLELSPELKESLSKLAIWVDSNHSRICDNKSKRITHIIDHIRKSDIKGQRRYQLMRLLLWLCVSLEKNKNNDGLKSVVKELRFYLVDVEIITWLKNLRRLIYHLIKQLCQPEPASSARSKSQLLSHRHKIISSDSIDEEAVVSGNTHNLKPAYSIHHLKNTDDKKDINRFHRINTQFKAVTTQQTG